MLKSNIEENVAVMQPLYATDLVRQSQYLPCLLEMYSDVEQKGNIGGWFYDISNNELFWTKQTYQIYGLASDTKITPELAISFYAPNDVSKIESSFSELLETGIEYELELSFIDAKGKNKWVQTNGQVLKTNSPHRIVYGTVKDITEQKVLFLSEANVDVSHRAILDNVNDCIITSDKDGVILSASRSIHKIFGYSSNEIIGQSLSILMPKRSAVLHNGYMQKYQETGRAKIIGIGRELPAIRKNGEVFPIELSLSEIVVDNEKAYIGIIRDISERKRAERQVHQLAFFDKTTGLYNMAKFEMDLDSAIRKAEAMGEPISVILLNIDKFSQVNIAFGRGTGDVILKLVGEKLSRVFDTLGDVYRYSDDKFFVIVSSTNGDTLENKFKEIQLACYSQGEDTEQSTKLTLSIVSVEPIKFCPNVQDTVSLLESNLKDVKRDDSISYRIIGLDDIKKEELKKSIIKEVKSSTFLDELSIVLQPQFNASNQFLASEVLVRWHSHKLGFVRPDLFIPLIEESGHIVELGYWVASKAADLIAEVYSKTNRYQKIAINVSAKQLAQPDFTQKIQTIFNARHIPFDTITIELTESVLISNVDLTIEKMRELSSLGFEFSIDDFGTGYSSLSYIKHLPLRELKFDKQFVDDIVHLGSEVPIVDAVLGLAKALKLNTVAEGIESKVQFDYLSNLGCECFQGYYLSKPMEEDDWKQYCARVINEGTECGGSNGA